MFVSTKDHIILLKGVKFNIGLYDQKDSHYVYNQVKIN